MTKERFKYQVWVHAEEEIDGEMVACKDIEGTRICESREETMKVVERVLLTGAELEIMKQHYNNIYILTGTLGNIIENAPGAVGAKAAAGLREWDKARGYSDPKPKTSSEEQKNRCDICAYFHADYDKNHEKKCGVDLHQCRRREPSRGWPYVKPDDWCGEFKFEENKAAALNKED